MFNKIRTAAAGRLTRSLVAASLGSAAALAVIAAPIAADAAPAGCASACVNNLEVQRQGLAMGTTFDTTVNTVDHLYVYRAGNLISQAANSTYRTHHTLATPEGLAANTTYNWHLVVTDAAGNQFERTGDMTTLHRRVTVLFSTDTVTNDSDDHGSGEFRTFVGLPSGWQVPLLTPKDIDTGQTVGMGTVLQQVDAGTSTQVRTEMYDDDYVWVPGGTLPNLPVWTSGSNLFGDWATAYGSLDTWKATNGMKPFQIQVNLNVGFVVRGSYSVDFVA